MAQVGEWLERIRSQRASASETAALEARLLVAHVLQRSTSWVLAHPEHPLNQEEAARLTALLARLKKGEPLPYLLGHWEFFGLDFLLTPDVLIPRPESEVLVEKALSWLEANPLRRLAADVGSGSGCLAVSLAVNLPDLRALACDLSWAALEVARQNALRHGVAQRVQFVQSDLAAALGKGVDMVCANLPYIPTERLESLSVSQWEPRLALDGGERGMQVIERFFDQVGNVLNPGGLTLMELDTSHAREALELARRLFPDAQIELFPDLAGRERVLQIQMEVI